MRLYSSIALAAVAAVLVTPVAAEAKTKKHHVAAAAAEGGLTTSEQLRLAQEQISQLQAQLNAVAAKLDKAATQTDVAAANTAATSAATKADKALAAADAVKVAEVKTAKSVDLMKWAADTKVTGRMYFNTSAISANGSARERDGGFQIKRAYIGIDHQFNKTFAFNVTMDADNIVRAKGVSDDSAKSSTQGIFLKKAYLEAKIDPALVIRAGASDMPWVPFVEGLYGYRHVEKTFADLNSLGTSTDWGVHVGGSLANGLIGYQVSAVDGAGYRNPQIGQAIDFEGRVNVNYMGFTAAVGGYTGKLGAKLNPGTTVNGLAVPGTTAHTAERFDALLAYKGNLMQVPFSIGAEYLWSKNNSQNQVAGYDLGTAASNTSTGSTTLLINGKYYKPVAQDKQEGFSVFASISPIAKWSVFGRYDWVKTNGYTAPGKRDHYFNAGIQYEPAKIIDLALVYKRDSGDGGISTGNLASGQVTRDEIGLFGQVRF